MHQAAQPPKENSVVADTFSATLGVLLKGMGNDFNTWGNTFTTLEGKKRPAHRPPDPNIAARNNQIVQEFRNTRAENPNRPIKEIHFDLRRRYDLSSSSITKILKGV
jgi:hypothetical protein